MLNAKRNCPGSFILINKNKDFGRKLNNNFKLNLSEIRVIYFVGFGWLELCCEYKIFGIR